MDIMFHVFGMRADEMHKMHAGRSVSSDGRTAQSTCKRIVSTRLNEVK